MDFMPEQPNATPEAKPTPEPEPAPVVREHTGTFGGQTIRYRTTTGRMEIKNAKGETEGRIFYIAYEKLDVEEGERRPLMFSFNGGPGSASVWLHFGALGPKRVRMEDEGHLPPAPYELVDNPASWLEHTDLVFIDPVGTGYSRPETPELGEKFWGIQGDIESIGEFIRLFLTKFERWSSPLFLVGESYGTTRAAGLAGYLVDRGIAFNGILLVSSILNFQTARFNIGNDLPYILFLPTYAATAWYHGKVDRKRYPDLRAFLDEVGQWANSEYVAALALGDQLPAKRRSALIARMAAYTGLSKDYLDRADCRIEIMGFCKELMRKERRTVGRLDTRFLGIDLRQNADKFEHDPSMTAIRPPYTAMANDYYRRTLGYQTDMPYHILGEGIEKPWNWGSAGEGHPDTSEALRRAMSRNPHMKVFVASGFYDLATPFFATEYTIAHMGLDPEIRGNIQTAEYEAGHMMYIAVRELDKLAGDAASFIRASL
ncbi:MAG: peptidase S10 [Chthonomonas sp.]